VTSLTLLLLLAVSVVPAGQTFDCTPTRLWDGDGPFWCTDGRRSPEVSTPPIFRQSPRGADALSKVAFPLTLSCRSSSLTTDRSK